MRSLDLFLLLVLSSLQDFYNTRGLNEPLSQDALLRDLNDNCCSFKPNFDVSEVSAGLLVKHVARICLQYIERVWFVFHALLKSKK